MLRCGKMLLAMSLFKSSPPNGRRFLQRLVPLRRLHQLASATARWFCLGPSRFRIGHSSSRRSPRVRRAWRISWTRTTLRSVLSKDPQMIPERFQPQPSPFLAGAAARQDVGRHAPQCRGALRRRRRVPQGPRRREGAALVAGPRREVPRSRAGLVSRPQAVHTRAERAPGRQARAAPGGSNSSTRVE